MVIDLLVTTTERSLSAPFSANCLKWCCWYCLRTSFSLIPYSSALYKPKSSCSHVLFTFKTVVDHYVECGSTVTVCSLDISKAFDKVDHHALLQVLMDKSLPRNFTDVLFNWLTKCFACVCWGGAFSFWFPISAGVKQGGVLTGSVCPLYKYQLLSNLLPSPMVKEFMKIGQHGEVILFFDSRGT